MKRAVDLENGYFPSRVICVFVLVGIDRSFLNCCETCSLESWSWIMWFTTLSADALSDMVHAVIVLDMMLAESARK